MSWSDPTQKEDDERAKVPRESATWKCVCGAIKAKWLSESRCSYCEPVKVERDDVDMPSLTPDEQARMLNDERACAECGERTSKNYCRQCDEFFYDGHAASCSKRKQGMGKADHAGHRTY